MKVKPPWELIASHSTKHGTVMYYIQEVNVNLIYVKLAHGNGTEQRKTDAEHTREDALSWIQRHRFSTAVTEFAERARAAKLADLKSRWEGSTQ